MTGIFARRRWMLAATASVLSVAVVGVSVGRTTPVAAATDHRPNILLVLTDDQRFATLAQLSTFMPKTAAFFGTGGRQFSRFHVAIPNCCPSRSAQMNGQYAHNTRVEHQADGGRLDQRGTFVHYLHKAGYRTAFAGKYLNSWPLADAPPDFDHYRALRAGYKIGLPTNDDGELRVTDAYSTTWLGRGLRRFLRDFDRTDDRAPWFAELSTTAPHTVPGNWPDLQPATPAVRYTSTPVARCRQRGEDTSDKPAYVRWHQPRPDYDEALCESQVRTLMSVDDQVGAILTDLAEQGELANTLVMFTSDNGLMWGEHNLHSKFVPYRPSLRVPLLVRWPGHIAGGTDHRLSANIDVLPTILDAAGLRADRSLPPIDGKSLLDRGGHRDLLAEYWVDSHNDSTPTWAAMHDGHRKYVETYRADGRTVTFREYYNLDADPNELTNLLHDGDPDNNPSVGPLSARLAQLRTCSGKTCP